MMRTLVVRTFVGSCATLLMSVVNLSVLTILDGEPGYVCLCLCNLDSKFPFPNQSKSCTC
jgi:hypothetical protein